MQHLLIVEDDKVDQIAFERFVKNSDFPYTFQLVGSIKDAKNALKEHTFDAVVSDYFLGDGTAFELLTLKLEVPFIVVTGTGSEELAVEALKKGAYDYLIKDVDGYYLRMLPITLKNSIQRFEAEKENKEYHNNLELLIQKRTEELQKEIEIRKTAEKNLKKLSTAVHQATSSITITDTHGIIEYVNPKFLEVTGYALDEVVGKNPNILKSGTHTEEFYKTLWKTINKGEIFSCEMQNKKKDGSIFWESVSISSIVNEKREIINYLKVGEDITEGKKATIALQKSEDDLQKAQEIAQIGTYNLNLKTYSGFCSKTFFQITELDYQQELEFSTWRALVFPEDLESNKKELDKSICERLKFDHTFRIITKKTKTLKWIHGIGEVFFDENKNPDSFVGVMQDVTIQKRAEQIQKALYNISNDIAKNYSLKHLIKLIQVELGKIIDTSNFYVTLYNKEKNLIEIPFRDEDKNTITNSHADKTLTNYVIQSNKSQLFKKHELEQLVKNNEIKLAGTLPEVYLAAPLKSEHKVIGTIVLQSFKDQNTFSEKDKELLEFVSGQIGQSIYRKKREEDLSLALENATESDRLKTAFLHNISHEIRTPMNGILGFSNLLQNPDLSGEKQQKYIEIITKSGNRLLSTINDLMDISKLETGQIKLNLSNTNIHEELELLYEFFKPEAANRGIPLNFHVPSSTSEIIIITDREKFYSIFSNLIKNALKYSQHGRIDFGYVDKKNELEFYVKDTGIGIPQHRQKAIFDRFVQADIDDKNVHEGSGLGLTISKSYIDMIGGKIWVTSTEGKGSQFYVTLPKNSVEKAAISIPDKSSKSPKVKPLKNLKILIAEDDEAAYTYLSIVLEDVKITPLHARNGFEAVEICKNNADLDLILMDIKMPIMNGYTATKKIREFNKEVVIIAQTAYALQGDLEAALTAGCNSYISKPFNAEKITKLIDTFFNK